MVTIANTPARPGGRRPSTSQAELSHIALTLFIEHGFEQTTLDEIAAAAGIGRRTFFRYFASKNDLPWGAFDEQLDQMAAYLHTFSADVPLLEVLGSAIVEFNKLPLDEVPYHRQRMNLLLNVPALVAHSSIRYASWRQVIADYVAERLNVPASALEPQTIAWTLLGLSLSAYEQWLAADDADLADLLRRAILVLRSTLNSATALRPLD